MRALFCNTEACVAPQFLQGTLEGTMITQKKLRHRVPRDVALVTKGAVRHRRNV